METLNIYAILVGIGASLAIWQVLQTHPGREGWQWGVAGLWILLGAWLGARLAFFIWQPAALVDFGWQAVSFRQGGMVWPGAAVGAWFTFAIVALFKKTSLLQTTDHLIVMLPPLAVMAWLAAWFSGSAYGPQLPADWWVPLTLDDQLRSLPRFPLQFIASASLFLIYLIVEPRLSKIKRVGGRTAITWLIFSVHTIIFSFLRADPRPEWIGYPWDIWFLLICFIWGARLTIIIFRGDHHA